MTLTIEIPCKTETEMEDNLNKAIEDFAKGLKAVKTVEVVKQTETSKQLYAEPSRFLKI